VSLDATSRKQIQDSDSCQGRRAEEWQGVGVPNCPPPADKYIYFRASRLAVCPLPSYNPQHRHSEQLKALPVFGEAYSEKIIKGRLCQWKDELVQKKILPRATYEQIKYKIVAKQK
jgi:hypothetical protein